MARRPMHLRRIYLTDHLLWFGALTALFIAALVGVVVFIDGTMGGLLLGAVPTLFVVVLWATTNRAGYPNRDPATLPHQRPNPEAETESAGGSSAGRHTRGSTTEAGDPFAPAGDTPPASDPPTGAGPEPSASAGSHVESRTHAPKARRLIEDTPAAPSKPSPDRRSTARDAGDRQQTPGASAEGRPHGDGARSSAAAVKRAAAARKRHRKPQAS